MKLKGIIITVVIVLVGIVLIQNTDVVGFNLLFWEFQMSRIILFPSLLSVGIVIGLIIGFIMNKKSK
jgi:uncharacterized integral membrane protein